MREYVRSLKEERSLDRGKKYEKIHENKMKEAQSIKEKKASDALAIRNARWDF